MDIPILEFHYHPSPFCQGYGLLVKRTLLQGFNFLFKNFQQNYYLAPHINKLKTYTYLLSCLYFWVFEWCALICCSLFKLVTSSYFYGFWGACLLTELAIESSSVAVTRDGLLFTSSSIFTEFRFIFRADYLNGEIEV